MTLPRANSVPEWRAALGPAFAVAFVTFVVFSPSLWNKFLRYDDYGYLLENPLVLDLSWKGLARIFTEFHICNYQPVVMLAMRILYTIFGLNEFVYHLFPLMLHTANTCLLFFILVRMGIRPWAAVICALFFSVHPLRVEGVVWVYAGFNYSISSFFFLSAVLAYLIKLQEGSLGSLGSWTIPILFCLAALSKSAAIVLPFVLLMLDFLLKRPWSRDLLKEKIPLFVLAIVFLFVGMLAQYSGGAADVGHEFATWERPVMVLKALAYYLVKTIWPVNLSVIVPYPTRQELLMPWSYGNVLLLMTVFLGCLVAARRTRTPLFVTGWYVICIFPALRLVPLGHSLVGDRYTYLPAIGLSIGIAMMLESLKNVKRRQFALAVLGAALLCLGTLSWKQSKVWKDDLSLWKHTVSVVPESVLAHTHLGSAYAMAGRLEEARAEFKTVQKIAPDLTHADFGFGKVYGIEGDLERAAQHFERVIQMDPTHHEANVWLGIAYCGLKEWKNAHRVFQKARELGGNVPEQFLEEVLKHAQRKTGESP